MRENKTIRRPKDAPAPPDTDSVEPLPIAEVPVQIEVEEPEAPPERGPSLNVDALMAEVNDLTPEQLAELMSGAPRRYRPGNEATGTVVRIEGESVYVDVGGKSEALIDLSELEERPTLGSSITAYVLRIGANGMQLSKRIGGPDADRETLEQAKDAGVPVEGRVKSSNSGGFTVIVGSVTAFCPISQIDRFPGDDPSIYIDKVFPFRIIDMPEGKIVLSRRVILDEEAEVKAVELWETTAAGDVAHGVVTGVREFGVFVDIGGIQGLVHRSELAWSDEATPPSRGDRVSVRILEVNKETKRISMSMKDPAFSPWNKVGTEFMVGGVYTGTVMRLTDFGAFVKLAPGLEGLVHISNISKERIEHPDTVLRVEERVQVRVLNIDDDRQRLGLGIKQVSDPDTDAAPQSAPTPRSHAAGNLGTMADIFSSLKLKK
ncbi:MAG: small subunit ribosomal protein S1 [Myxococcota bacterium]|jgi:small subunit ribosomal protein S1